MITVDCEQGTDQWFQARLGVVTASCFDNIITPTGKATTGAKPTTYMNTLIAEWLVGKPIESFQSEWMKRGTELEPEARDYYAFTEDCEPVEVGFVYLNDKKHVGCSPDALVDSNGLWENKAPAPHTHVSYLLGKKLPTKYIPQVQGQLWVCEREWCDFMSYHPYMEPLLIRVTRDDKYIKDMESMIDNFVNEMLEKREKLTKQESVA